MDAIMIALVAVLLANADGRAGAQLARLLTVRGDRRTVVAVAFVAFAVNALVAALAGAIANRLIGQGIAALCVAFALLAAATALLWRGRSAADAGVLERASPAGLALRLGLVQLGDRSHFLIGAFAATSGAGVWAAAGGFVGWTLSLLPLLAFGPALAQTRAAGLVRLTSGTILALWGVRTGLRAFGI